MCRQAAVLKDLKERIFAGREERSNWRSARGKRPNSRNVLPSRTLSQNARVWAEAEEWREKKWAAKEEDHTGTPSGQKPEQDCVGHELPCLGSGIRGA